MQCILLTHKVACASDEPGITCSSATPPAGSAIGCTPSCAKVESDGRLPAMYRLLTMLLLSFESALSARAFSFAR